MKLITTQQIKNIHIPSTTCLEWIKQSFLLKEEIQLPAKSSLHPQGNDFFNAMPCLLPNKYHRFGIKIVHRIQGAEPALGSDIFLYDSLTGELLAMIDGDWITTMRTGAVATLAIQTLRKTDAVYYSFIGLGNTARATMLCLLENEPETMHEVLLYKYKDQAEIFSNRFKEFKNVHFTIIDQVDELIAHSDVLVSCITDAQGLLCEDNSRYKEGCLVVPVHTRGFQNCDLFFDKVFADDTNHVSNFKYFDQFNYFAELSDVLTKKKSGRTNNSERILSYNIGLGMHDVFFANNLYNLLSESSIDLSFPREKDKFWI